MKTMNRLLRWCLPVKVNAITLPPFGIYARLGHETDPKLTAHEAVHWAQYERMGLLRFYATYLWQLMRYGYDKHPMEVEAQAQSKKDRVV